MTLLILFPSVLDHSTKEPSTTWVYHRREVMYNLSCPLSVQVFSSHSNLYAKSTSRKAATISAPSMAVIFSCFSFSFKLFLPSFIYTFLTKSKSGALSPPSHIACYFVGSVDPSTKDIVIDTQWLKRLRRRLVFFHFHPPKVYPRPLLIESPNGWASCCLLDLIVPYKSTRMLLVS